MIKNSKEKKEYNKKDSDKKNDIQIIEKAYLYEKLEKVLDKENTVLLYLDIKILRSIGAKIEAIIYKEEGLSHQDCSEATTIIKSIIDEKYQNADEYTITVSSPGFKWLFRSEKEFKIFKNAPIKVIYNKKASEILKAKTVTGLLLSYDDESIEVENERENICISRNAIEKIYLNY